MGPIFREIENGIYEIEELGFMSSYLIVGRDRSVIIDTGFGLYDFRELSTKYTPHEILVINTHIHPDHSNGNRYFMKTSMSQREWENHGIKWNNATKNILIGSWDPSAMFKIVRLEDKLPSNYSKENYNAFVAQGIPQPDHLWKGNETIDLGGRSIEIIPTPAHTTGSISILDHQTGSLFMGDCFAKGAAWYLHLKCHAPLTDIFNTYATLSGLSGDINRLYPALGEKGLNGDLLKDIDQDIQSIANKEVKGEKIDHLTGKAIYYQFKGYGVFMPPEELDGH